MLSYRAYVYKEQSFPSDVPYVPGKAFQLFFRCNKMMVTVLWWHATSAPAKNSDKVLSFQRENAVLRYNPHVHISIHWHCPQETLSFKVCSPFLLLHCLLRKRSWHKMLDFKYACFSCCYDVRILECISQSATNTVFTA